MDRSYETEIRKLHEDFLLQRIALYIANKELEACSADALKNGSVINRQSLDERMQSAVRKFEQREEKKRRRIFYRKIAVRVAVIVLAFTVCFSTAFLTVEAFRIRVLNFVYNMTENYTEYQLRDESGATELDIVETETDIQHPGYIPEGLALEYTDETEASTILYYTGSNEGALTLHIMDSTNTPRVDTEDSAASIIQMNNVDVFVYEKNTQDKITFVWSANEHIYVMIGQALAMDEMIKTASSIDT